MATYNRSRFTTPDGDIINFKDNVSGYTTNTGTVTSVRVQATSPVSSSQNTSQTGTLNTTISLSDAYGDTKNPYGSKTANLVLASPNDSTGVPSFRSLTKTDIPALSGSDISYSNTTSGLSATDVQAAIDELEGGRMVILRYGISTWDDFITVYNKNAVVYCRASSNSNPASGSQTRLAFMAYVNNAESPTEVEFQYYRSVNTHSDTQQGDQVFVYKLQKTAGWTVTTRQTFTKVDTEKGLADNWSSGTIKLKANLKSETALTNDATAATEVANRVYPVALDKSGYLAVNVPWVESSVTSLLDVYPVGSIYMSVNSTSPATLFGGTWEQIQDTFLLSAGSTYTAGDTGGEATHTLTVDEIPSHNHSYSASTTNSNHSGGDGYHYLAQNYGTTTGNTGGGLAHNNMPPYLVVYMWKRTA